MTDPQRQQVERLMLNPTMRRVDTRSSVVVLSYGPNHYVAVLSDGAKFYGSKKCIEDLTF